MKNRELFFTVKQELESKGTLAATIETDPHGEWIGHVLEKDLTYCDPNDQVHFANLVFDGERRV
jgi:hypothetical protein